MVRRWILACAMIVGTAGAVFAQESARVGVFDPNRILQETNEGKRISQEIENYRKQKQGELDAKRKEILDLQTQLQTQGLSLSAERRAEMEKQIQKKSIDLNQTLETAQREDQLETSEALGKFQGQILAVLEQFARDEKFDLILEKSLVAYSSPAVDVTTALIDRFNAVVSSPAPAPAPAAGAGK